MSRSLDEAPPLGPLARPQVHAVLDGSLSDSSAAAAVHWLLIVLVLGSVACIVLETVPDLKAAYGVLFSAVEVFAIVVFSIEYALRVWCAPEQPIYAEIGPWRARFAFAKTPPALIDLAAVLPAYVSLPSGGEFKILLLLRLARFFKLARYSPGMRSLVAVLQAERRALLASAVILFGLILLSAAAMYSVEGRAQPDKLGSIPAAMWWATVTLTTVGYGDIYPVTALGRVVASVTMMFGLMMVALPVGILATAFSEEIHRREFVVTWGMIARVPLFEALTASEIGEITRFLHARTVPEGATIVRKGDLADSMFLIASGEVAVELPTEAVLLGEGQFFGEMALLRRGKRTRTVRARQATKLLVLKSSDFLTLMERNPLIRQRVNEVARQRQAEVDAPDDEAPTAQREDVSPG